MEVRSFDLHNDVNLPGPGGKTVARSRYGQAKRDKELARKQKYEEKLKRRQNKNKSALPDSEEEQLTTVEEQHQSIGAEPSVDQEEF